MARTPPDRAKNAVSGSNDALGDQTERIGHQAATIEILRAMSASPADAQPVFELIARRARELCGASGARLTEFDGELVHLRALVRADGIETETDTALRQLYPAPPDEHSISGRVIVRRGIVHNRDEAEIPLAMRGRYIGSVVGVPLLRDDRVIGVIALSRSQSGGFSDTQIELLQTFAEQAVIAIGSAETFRQLEARNADNASLIARQTASIEVLKTISASPDDTAPVFDLIVLRARELCGAQTVSVMMYDGELIHLRAMDGYDQRTSAAFAAAWPRPVSRDTISGRTILDGRVTEVSDGTADPTLMPAIRELGSKALLGVPLLRDGSVIGVIVLTRFEAGRFDASKIELVQNFADQAVIAISSAATFRQLQDRTAALALRNSEYGERIEQQSATIDVLQAMSASPGDPQPVFERIVRRAIDLCDATGGAVLTVADGMLHIRAERGEESPTRRAFIAAFPRSAGPDSIAGRAVLERRIAHVRDVEADPTLFRAARYGGARSRVCVPLMHEGTALGGITLVRAEPGGFSDSQIALLETFAEQAVIAMRSAETFRELEARTAALAERNSAYGERIEQQSATIDVLKAMSASPGDTQPVFDLIVRRALELCNGLGVALFEFDGELVRLRSSYGGDLVAQSAFGAMFPMPPMRGSIACRAILDGQIVHIRDVDAEPGLFQAVRNLGAKTCLSLPLVRDGRGIGAISLNTKEAGGFSDTQIELLQTFAEQAVIAIGSAATFRELQTRTAALAKRNSEYGERIEQQSATIDVLKVMSSSPDDTQPVFDLITERALAFCEADNSVIWEYDGTLIHVRAYCGKDQRAEDKSVIDKWRGAYPMAADPARMTGTVVLERRVVHVRDAETDPWFRADGLTSRSRVMVPLLRGEQVIGCIGLSRLSAGGFSDTQIELLKTFAEQAVIAIGSVANFRALRERTGELTEALETQSATADVLKAISRAAYDLDSVLTMLILTALRLCDARHGQIWRKEGEVLRYAASHGNVPAYREIEQRTEIRPGRGTLVGRVALEQRPVQIVDAWNDPEYQDKEAARLGQARSMLGVPLLRDGELIGAFALARTDPLEFTDRQVELVRTFADQAVIAIENVRLFDEVQARTAELTRSVAELQALEEVLRAVNSSLDLDTVLATVISRAVQLSQADEGTIYEYDAAEEIFVPKAAFGMSAARVAALRERRIRLGETHLGRSAMLRAPVYVEDVQQDPSIPNASETLPGIHAVLAVPLLREDEVVGGLVIRRRTEVGFAPTIVTLMQTFAGQCVLAIENARLFQELATRGEEARRARAAAEATLADLRRAQDRLVQSEKMASLGQLTAGIAHEIKNPLNFINNFSDLSGDLLDELSAALAPEKLELAAELRAEIDELTAILKGNLRKITEHGRRADSIVKNMLLHSRADSGERRPVDLNATAEEALNLAYHGARAQMPGFNITLEKDFDPEAGMAELFPQEIIRVLLNLISNGFYAAHKRAEAQSGGGFEPTLRLSTRDLGGQVEIRVRDNGTGIAETIREKIFEPFFTTKPAGEGTGLGLSLSYDIVVKQHGGQMSVDSQENAFTEFVIILPRTPPAGGHQGGES